MFGVSLWHSVLCREPDLLCPILFSTLLLCSTVSLLLSQIKYSTPELISISLSLAVCVGMCAYVYVCMYVETGKIKIQPVCVPVCMCVCLCMADVYAGL